MTFTYQEILMLILKVRNNTLPILWHVQFRLPSAKLVCGADDKAGMKNLVYNVKC